MAATSSRSRWTASLWVMFQRLQMSAELAGSLALTRLTSSPTRPLVVLKARSPTTTLLATNADLVHGRRNQLQLVEPANLGVAGSGLLHRIPAVQPVLVRLPGDLVGH